MLRNLVEASFDLFRYLLPGDQLKPWELKCMHKLCTSLNVWDKIPGAGPEPAAQAGVSAEMPARKNTDKAVDAARARFLARRAAGAGTRRR